MNRAAMNSGRETDRVEGSCPTGACMKAMLRRSTREQTTNEAERFGKPQNIKADEKL